MQVALLIAKLALPLAVQPAPMELYLTDSAQPVLKDTSNKAVAAHSVSLIVSAVTAKRTANFEPILAVGWPMSSAMFSKQSAFGKHLHKLRLGLRNL